MDAVPTKSSEAVQPKQKSGGVVIPHQPKWYQRVGAFLIVASIRAVAVTLRYRLDDQTKFFESTPPGPVIYCVWHNRLTLSTPCPLDTGERYARRRGWRAGFGRAGERQQGRCGFLAGILQRFHVEPVRGSSSRRGPQALLELTTLAEQGYDLAITPDGPRGPRYLVQEGATSLAQLTGLPIVPFSAHLGWKISVKSWDRFQIPLPFSRCEMRAAPLVRVPREATEAQREELRQRLETALRAITRD